MSEDVRVKLRGNTLWLEDVGKQTLTSLESAFNEENEKIDKIREKLAMLIAGNPKDLMTKFDEEEYGTVTGFIEEKINEIMGDASEVYAKLERLSILENILDEWAETFSYNDDDKYVLGPVDFKDNEQITTFVYPVRKLDKDTENERMNVEFYGKPHESNSFEEIFEAGKKNIETNNKMSDAISCNWVAFFDDKLFVTYDGQFVFKDTGTALKAIKDQMGQTFVNRCSLSYVVNEPMHANKFFDDVKAYTSPGQEKFIDECIEKIKNNKAFYATTDCAKLFDIMNDAFDKYLGFHIKYFQLSELAK